MFLGVFMFGPVTMKAQMNAILIGYGIEGEPLFFSYQLTEHDKDQLTCELVSEGKTITREHFEWRSNLQTLSRDILDDFAKTIIQIETDQPGPKEKQRKIVIEFKQTGLETAITITASDLMLKAFVHKSTTIKEVLRKISNDKPKMYRLGWFAGGESLIRLK